MVQEFEVLNLNSTSDTHGRYPSFTLSFVEPVGPHRDDIRKAVEQYATEMNGIPAVDGIDIENDHLTIKFGIKDHESHDALLDLAERVHQTYTLDHVEHGFRGRRFATEQ